MHVRREARLVDDHRCGVELSLAPTPNKSSQKNRPDAPYEGLPPNRWMPGTNAKCPRPPGPSHPRPVRITTVTLDDFLNRLSNPPPPPDVLGMTAEQATQLATEHGVEVIRVLQSADGVTIDRMTMDRNPPRLNLIVKDGIVVRVGFF